MNRNRAWSVTILVAGTVLLAGCREAATETPAYEEPYRLEPVEGTDLTRVILTADGADRIGLETDAVVSSGERLLVPASAIWVDVDGQAWVYRTPAALTYVREPVTVERYEGTTAILSDGPPPGTEVVSVGVAELIGSEFGI